MENQAKQKQAAVTENNAIMVDKKVVESVYSWLSASANKAGRLTYPCSKREMIDEIVLQMGNMMSRNPWYFKGDSTDYYKWFDSDIAKAVQNQGSLVDKGRFVAACLIAYKYGEKGLSTWCTRARKVYPPKLNSDQMAIIEKIQAAKPDPEEEEIPADLVPMSVPIPVAEGNQSQVGTADERS